MARQPLIFQTGLNGDGVRDTIVMWLYKFHNSVNGSKGGDEFVFEFLRHFYGTGIHADAVVDARRVLLEIEALWPPTSEWSAAARHLLGLIGGGELG